MWFQRISNKTKISIIFVAIILATYLIWRFILVGGSFVPEQFLEANQQGSLIANRIVELSRESAENIKKINQLDREKKYEEAINLIMEEIKRNEEMKNQAFELSFKLANMTEFLNEIEPEEAVKVALKAMNYETFLIIRLINYNSFLGDLTSSLGDKFKGLVGVEEISEIIKKINDEAVAINDLNEQYKTAMAEFERLVK